MKSIKELLEIQRLEQEAIKLRLATENVDALLLNKAAPIDRRIFNANTGQEIFVDDPFFDGFNNLIK